MWGSGPLSLVLAIRMRKPHPEAEEELPQRKITPVRDNTMIDQNRPKVLQALRAHRIVIVVSSTGSGDRREGVRSSGAQRSSCCGHLHPSNSF